VSRAPFEGVLLAFLSCIPQTSRVNLWYNTKAWRAGVADQPTVFFLDEMDHPSA